MSASALKLKSLNILIADIQVMYSKGLKSLLKNFSYVNQVDEAGNNSEALKLLEKNKYDLMFMGFPVYGLNGEPAMQLISKHCSKTRVIALSLLEDSFTVRKLFLAGCYGCLSRSSKEEEFAQAIDAVFSGKKYFKDKIIEKLLGESEDECIARLRRQLSLTQDEFRLIQLVCEGKTNKEIENIMNVAIRTEEKYRNSAYHKIGVSNSVELMRFAIRNNIISVESIKAV